MNPINRRAFQALAASMALVALLAAGDGKKSSLTKKDPPLKVDETVGDLAYVRSVGEIQVEGVGLVVGLDGTGSKPEPSQYLQKLLGQMRAARIEHPEQVLSGTTTSLVIVRAKIPIGITRDDVFDAEVELTPGSGTTSLDGGVLLKTELTQVAYANGQPHEGQVLALAGGPIVAGTAANPTSTKSGRLLGGARVKKDQPYLLVIKDNRRSIKTAALLQSVIATRFFYLDGVDQKGMANAKSDQWLEVRVPKTYHQNQARYFQILQLLPIVDNTELRARRTEQWTQELLDPKTAGVAALKLEGIGRNAVEPLRKGLASKDPNVRFFSAEALAYLNDPSGVDVLADAALNRADFRAFALGALSAADHAASIAKLRDLLSRPEVEVRYGAFNALRALDPNDVFLGRTRVIRYPAEPATDEDGENAMAMQIAAARARRNRPPDPFSLYLVDCDGPPLIHASNSRRSEIVVFGKQQRLLPPIVLGDPSSVLLNASLEDSRIQLTRLAGGNRDATDQTVTSLPQVGHVIVEAASLGVTYPQIVTLLRAAEKQRNLEGPLVLDAIPAPAPEYDKAQLAGVAGETKGRTKKDPSVERAAGSKTPRKGLIGRLLPSGTAKKSR